MEMSLTSFDPEAGYCCIDPQTIFRHRKKVGAGGSGEVHEVSRLLIILIYNASCLNFFCHFLYQRVYPDFVNKGIHSTDSFSSKLSTACSLQYASTLCTSLHFFYVIRKTERRNSKLFCNMIS